MHPCFPVCNAIAVMDVVAPPAHSVDSAEGVLLASPSCPLIHMPPDVLAKVCSVLWRRDVAKLQVAHRAFASLPPPGLVSVQSMHF